MCDYCVVVVDSARARFFTLENPEVPEIESGPNLVERRELRNPEGAQSGRETWTESRSGGNSAPGGGAAHGYDDHRDGHEDEVSRRFAKRVAEASRKLAHRSGARCLVLVAANRMLGFLREATPVSNGNGLEVREIAKDLVRQSPHDIHRNLGGAGVLPARGQRAGAH